MITLAGAIAGLTLPITQYPNVTPPQIAVRATYAGAAVLEQAIAIPIEQEVNGAQNMIYLSSRSANDGTYTLVCTFEPGTDPDIAAADVQTRVLQAQGNLPPTVIENGVRVKKRCPTTLMIVTLYSPDRSYDALFLSNYAQINVVDPVARVQGIGDFSQIGHTYAMRVWLQPDRMAALGVAADDLATALEQQNIQTPGGQIGGPPAAQGTDVQYCFLPGPGACLPCPGGIRFRAAWGDTGRRLNATAAREEQAWVRRHEMHGVERVPEHLLFGSGSAVSRQNSP